MKNKIENSIQVENHLKSIILSLNNSYLKTKEWGSPFIIEKEKMIYKLIDELKITTKEAIDYLKILKSRNFLEIGRQEIIFFPESLEKVCSVCLGTKYVKFEICDYCKGIGKRIKLTEKEAEKEAEKIIKNVKGEGK
jgi:hypothetical protein